MSNFSLNLSDFVFVWWALLFEALPFVVLGALISGLLECCLSRQAVTRLFPRNRFAGILVGASLGMVLPMCECGVVPIVRRLMLKGVPVPCGIAFLLASPIVNPLVIASTAIAFRGKGGWEVVALRVGLGYLIAVLVATIVGRLRSDGQVLRQTEARDDPPGDGPDLRDPPGDCPDFRDETGDCPDFRSTKMGLSPSPPSPPLPPPPSPIPTPRGSRWTQVLTVAAGEFIVIGGTLALGAAVAAVINAGFSRQAMLPLVSNPLLAVPGMMVLAIALNLCSEADAFVAASFYAFPLAAKLAFLVLGPMVDIKLMLVYWAVFRPKVAVTILGLVVVLVLAFCLAMPYWLPLLSGTWFR